MTDVTGCSIRYFGGISPNFDSLQMLDLITLFPNCNIDPDFESIMI